MRSDQWGLHPFSESKLNSLAASMKYWQFQQAQGNPVNRHTIDDLTRQMLEVLLEAPPTDDPAVQGIQDFLWAFRALDKDTLV